MLRTLLAVAMEAGGSAGPATAPKTAIDPNRVSAGWFGLLTLVFMIVAVVFLYKSMRKQLARVNVDAAAGSDGRSAAAGARSGGRGGGRSGRTGAAATGVPGPGDITIDISTKGPGTDQGRVSNSGL